jgi:hypothetical protein
LTVFETAVTKEFLRAIQMAAMSVSVKVALKADVKVERTAAA